MIRLKLFSTFHIFVVAMENLLRLRHGFLNGQQHFIEFCNELCIPFGMNKARGAGTGSDLMDAVTDGAQFPHHAIIIGRRTVLWHISFVEQQNIAGYGKPRSLCLAENGLLPLIVAEFQESYSECDTLLKMARASELEDNNVNAIVARFTTGILDRVDAVGEVLKNKFDDFDLKDILGTDFKQEDLAKLSSFLDKYK